MVQIDLHNNNNNNNIMFLEEILEIEVGLRIEVVLRIETVLKIEVVPAGLKTEEDLLRKRRYLHKLSNYYKSNLKIMILWLLRLMGSLSYARHSFLNLKFILHGRKK